MFDSFDSSDFSMSSVASNPTMDIFDDGGSSADFSNALQSATQLGSEIAGVVAGFSAPTPSRMPVYPQNILPPGTKAPGTSSNNAAIVLVIVLGAAVVWVLMSQKRGGA